MKLTDAERKALLHGYMRNIVDNEAAVERIVAARLAQQREALAAAIEDGYRTNLTEQADHGPSVDHDWLLGALILVVREYGTGEQS